MRKLGTEQTKNPFLGSVASQWIIDSDLKDLKSSRDHFLDHQVLQLVARCTLKNLRGNVESDSRAVIAYLMLEHLSRPKRRSD